MKVITISSTSYQRRRFDHILFFTFNVFQTGHNIYCLFIPAAEECRIIMFKEPTLNTVIEGHLISRAEVLNEGSCRVKCYMEPNCVSINMGLSIGGKTICELNNATGENEFAAALKYKAAHTYLAIEVKPVIF